MIQIVDMIKYEGNNDTLIWKHPSEDFNTLSQLIVHETQEALLFLNGQALDLYGPGKHTLHTNNIPLLNRIVNLPTGGVSPFHCEVYFVNKTEQMAINWGMGNVNYLDPKHNDYAFKIGASGEMSVRVSDARKLVTKLVGTETTFDQEKMCKYFKTPITTHIKTMLPQILREKKASIFEVEKDLSNTSELLKYRISDEMSDYGISLEKFWISTILVPESDPFYITLNSQRGQTVTVTNQGEINLLESEYRRRAEIIDHTGEVQKRKMDIDTKRYEQEQLGFTYQQEHGFVVMEKIAENEGSGSDLRNAAMGIGMGFGLGGTFSDVVTNISNNTMMANLTDSVTPSPLKSEFFENVPGMINLKDEVPEHKKNDDEDLQNFKKKLDKLVMMKDAGILTEEEFAERKKVLLDEIEGM